MYYKNTEAYNGEKFSGNNKQEISEISDFSASINSVNSFGFFDDP